jgi:putative DNA primase/helicase
VAQLRGARLAVAVEAEEDRRLAESLVKQMTGGDTMSARFMKAEWFQFTPEFKIFLATNHRPVIRGTDHAMWRRVRLIPFAVTIPRDQQDQQLEAKLLTEAPGILTWLVEGCRAWQRDGLQPPEAVQAATKSYRDEMDVLGRFIADCCVIEPAAEATARDLYEAYTAWASKNGEKALSQVGFGRRLGEREGIEKHDIRAARGWRGLRVGTP